MSKYCGECGHELADGRTIINVILDESGSMYDGIDDTIGAFNRYMDGLKEDNGGATYLVTLTKFNVQSRVVFKLAPISKVKKLTRKNYVPGNGTALLDAIGKTLTDIKSEVKSTDKVITVIVTDGHENSSREYSKAAVQEMVKKLSKKNYTFVYLAADFDNMDDARMLGVPLGNTFSYAKSASTGASDSLLRGTSHLAASGQSVTSNFYQDAGIDNSEMLKEDDEIKSTKVTEPTKTP